MSAINAAVMDFEFDSVADAALHAEVDRLFGPCLRPDCPSGRHPHLVALTDVLWDELRAGNEEG